MKKLSGRNVAYMGGDPEPEDFSHHSQKKRRNRLGIIVEVGGGKGKAMKKLTRRKSAKEHQNSSYDARQLPSPVIGTQNGKKIDVTEIDDFSSHSSFESKISNNSNASKKQKLTSYSSPRKKKKDHLKTEGRQTSPKRVVEQETVSKLSVISSKDDKKMAARFKESSKRKHMKSPPKFMMS